MQRWKRLRRRFYDLRDLGARKNRTSRTKGATVRPLVHNFTPRQALPRMLSDFINVHLCMMGALATPVCYLALRHQTDRATTRLSEAATYYASSFVLLSLLFPFVFLLHGFYTHSRAYIGRYKR